MLIAHTAATEDAAHRLMQAQRTGEPDALPDASRRPQVAAFFARNRAACDYANQLASDPNRFALEAEADRNEIGYAYYATR